MRDNSSKRRIIISVIVAVLLIAAFGFVVHLIEKHGLRDEQFGDTGGWGSEGKETIELSLNDEIYISDDDVDTYLLIGTDSGGEKVGDLFEGELADFVTLLVIDNTTKKFGFLQMDRNSMVPMDVPTANGESTLMMNQQLCISHWYGANAEERNENTVNAVSNLLGGLDIGSYYTVKMDDIGAVNHAIGGVVVDIDTDMTSVDPEFKKGASILLTDKQADKFVRARMGVGQGTNAERMARQTQYMQKAYNLIMNQLRENPEYLSDLYTELDGKIQTKSSNRDFSEVANKLVMFDSLGIMKFTGKTRIADTLGDGIEHEEFYVDESSIIDCLSKVINLTKAPDDYYDKADADDTEDDEDIPDDGTDDSEEGTDVNEDDTDYGEPVAGNPDDIQVIEK